MTARPRMLALLALLASACGPRVGQTCVYNEDCKGLSGGYCAKVHLCTVGCSGDSCPGGSSCVSPAPGLDPICLSQCKTVNDCNAGQNCADAGGALVCQVLNPFGPAR